MKAYIARPSYSMLVMWGTFVCQQSMSSPLRLSERLHHRGRGLAQVAQAPPYAERHVLYYPSYASPVISEVHMGACFLWETNAEK
jgi:hypothetical protein